MFKNCLLPTSYSNQQMQPPKCGEIYYRNERSFVLVCCVCDMKHFGFEDFVRHIQNAHFDEHGIQSNPNKQETLLRDLFKQEPEFQECQSNHSIDLATKVNEVDACNPLRILNLTESTEIVDEQQNLLLETDNVSIANETDWPLGNEPTVADYNESDDCEGDVEEYDEEHEREQTSTDENRVVKKPRLPKEYKCEHCSRSYTTERYLNVHVKLKHLSPKPYLCNQCDEAFSNERSLDSHRQKAHIGYPCTLCEKIYKHKELLRRHLQWHTGERSYQCDYENCGKSFVTEHALGQHKRTHTRDRNYVCEICGYRCRYKEALTVHRRSHTGEKPYACQTCSRAFASKSLLNEHQAMHSTERPYKCETCDAAFSRPKALYHHKHLHLAVKKFVCKICGNAYAQAAGLSAHMRGHKMQANNGVSIDAVLC